MRFMISRYLGGIRLSLSRCSVLLHALTAQGVCLLDGLVVLCDRVLPGERLLAEITTVRKGALSGRVLCRRM